MNDLKFTYDVLKEHLTSDEINIYTITSILVKNYNDANYIPSVLICFMCFIVQTTIPILVIYDIVLEILHYSDGICPKTGTTIDKISSSIMCLFLLFFYLHRWSLFIYQFKREEKSIILLKNIELYVSEIFFNFGFMANMLVHTINTITGLFILYQTKGALDIVIDSCVMYYFNDISNFFVTKKLKDQCKILLKKKYSNLISNKDKSMKELEGENITYRKWFDTHIGGIAFIFIIIVFPILSIGTLLSLLGGIIFIPICRP